MHKLLRRLQRQIGTHPGAAAIGASALTVAVIVVAWPDPSPDRLPPPASPGPPPPAELPCGGTLRVAGQSIVPGDPAVLGRLSGQPVEGRRLLVQSVPSDEGFWAGCEQARTWVQLVGEGESPFSLVTGQRVDFAGTMVVNPPDFANTVGLRPSDGVQELEQQGVHIEVLFTALVVM
jgi:hypothetical protein